MIESFVNEVNQAKNIKEILSYKSQILEKYNALGDKVLQKGCSKINFDDIENLYNLNLPMASYFGSNFFADCGIPFLQKYNPQTLDIIEFSILFYSLQICELLENNFFNGEIEEILTNEQDLYMMFWYCFKEIITLKDNTRKIDIYTNQFSEVYITDEKYENLINTIFSNYKNSKFSNVINNILGIYKIRFSNMLFILNYQKIFVEVGYKYLCAIIRSNENAI